MGMTKDYIVTSLALLHEAKCYPNDLLSSRLTPQSVGRVIFNTTTTPRFPLTPGYDVRREFILQLTLSTGRSDAVFGGNLLASMMQTI